MGKYIVGHEDTFKALTYPFPPVLLLSGPEGVGKRTAAIMLSMSMAKETDLHACGPLTVEKVKDVHTHHQQTPLVSKHRVSLIDLTHANEKSVNALLKILEEPPPYSRFVMHTDKDPMLTLKSRAFQLRFGLLSEADVLTVLRQQGIKEPEEAARFAGGRVSAGIEYAYSKDARGRVEGILLALRDIRGNDTRRLETALANALKTDFKDVTDPRPVVARLLLTSIYKSLYGNVENHVLGSVSEAARKAALDILRSEARPQFSVRSAVWVMARG